MYAARSSGEPFGLGIVWRAASETRVGEAWVARVGLGALTVAAAVWASGGGPRRWWLPAGFGAVMLATLTRVSHAAAKGGILPLAADWLHVVAASVWTGGLLEFALALLGPLRFAPEEQKKPLRRLAVRRFSMVASVAVATLVVSGSYAILLHVPSISALLGTPYGLALLAKLGLLISLPALGGANLLLGGRGAFERLVHAELVLALAVFVVMGLLTSLPPADTLMP